MDKPVEEIAKMCDFRIQQGFTIWQKWTCTHCDSRQTMESRPALPLGPLSGVREDQPDLRCGFMMAKGGIVQDIQAELTS